MNGAETIPIGYFSPRFLEGVLARFLSGVIKIQIVINRVCNPYRVAEVQQISLSAFTSAVVFT